MKKLILLLILIASCAIVDFPYTPTRVEGNTQQRTAYFINEYGENFGRRIASYSICIGMTKQMVVDAYGKPDKIKHPKYDNLSVKWIYSKKYCEVIFLADEVVEIIDKW